MKKGTGNKPANKKEARYLAIICAMFIVLIIACVLVFTKFYNFYMDKILYKERLSQMEEVTGQLFTGLEDVIDSQWNEAKIYCNYIELGKPETIEEMETFVGKEADLNNLEQKSTDIVAVDEEGRYYTQDGSQGVLAEMDYLLDEPEQVSFVSKAVTSEKTRMYFLYRLENPITLTTGTRTVNIVYYGLSRDMEQLNPYFSCDAYGGNNTVYIINENGEKLFSGNNGAVMEEYNVYSVLKKMEYLHGTSFEEAKRELDSTGKAYSNVIINNTEYYYSLYKMQYSQWTMFFLVPSEYVAVNTVQMMSTTVHMVLVFAIITILISVGMVITMFQIKQRQLEVMNRQLEAVAQEADSANKAKSEFLSNMSHDIRTPMNAIVGITNLMKHEEKNPEKLDAYINKLQISSRHLLSLINDVLDMSKIESSDVTFNVEPINLAEQVSQIANIIRPQAEEKQQLFHIHVSEIRHEFLLGDGVRIRQIFINLLSNAVKYTQTGGEISFELTELPSDVPEKARFSIVVTDNGYGMTPKFLEHIFEPFVRAENSTTNKVQGTGLGMAITKEIVDLMNGTIEVQSEKGKGSRFEVIIPLDVNEDVEYELSVKDVLLVCDEAALIENVGEALKKSGAVLQTVQTLDEAGSLMQKQNVDVVLLGNCIKEPALPDMIQTLRTKSENKVLVFCCDYANPEKVGNILHDSGADGLIQRPFFCSDFVKAINAAKENKELDTSSVSNPLEGKRFLCAEDNELNAEILAAILEMDGAECTIYRNGKEIVDAFLAVRPEEYDAILMDVQMPVMNGLEATKAIRESDNPLGRTIPIIAMTANAFSSDVQKCLDAGMNAHISKPLDIKVLARTIESLQTDMFFGGGGDICSPTEDNDE